MQLNSAWPASLNCPGGRHLFAAVSRVRRGNPSQFVCGRCRFVSLLSFTTYNRSASTANGQDVNAGWHLNRSSLQTATNIFEDIRHRYDIDVAKHFVSNSVAVNLAPAINHSTRTSVAIFRHGAGDLDDSSDCGPLLSSPRPRSGELPRAPDMTCNSGIGSHARIWEEGNCIKIGGRNLSPGSLL